MMCAFERQGYFVLKQSWGKGGGGGVLEPNSALSALGLTGAKAEYLESAVSNHLR